MEKLEMYFFEDMYAPCESCEGRRFKPEILAIRYRGKTISEVLNMTVDDARAFFSGAPRLQERLHLLSSIGLGSTLLPGILWARLAAGAEINAETVASAEELAGLSFEPDEREMMVEGLRRALETGGAPLTGEKVKVGLESIKDFSLGGLAPPLSTSPADHEGGGYTRVVAVKEGKLTPITDWANPKRDKVLALVAAGCEVTHIMEGGRLDPHRLSSAARLQGSAVVYDVPEEESGQRRLVD